MNKKDKILVLGSNGMVGSSICKTLESRNYKNIYKICRDDIDLTNQLQVQDFFKNNDFDQVFLCAAKVGGIFSNSKYPADFIHDNIVIQSNVISSCNINNINNLIFLGSSCIYPKNANQPIMESELLTGTLEKTNQWYAIAKIAGIKLCESFNIQYDRDYRSVMPTNLYGPNDNYHPKNSHVIPSLIRKFYEAKINKKDSVEIWGSGLPLREFLHVDDMADAAIYISSIKKNQYNLLTDNDLSHINVGSGKDISIKELAILIKEISEYKGDIYFNKSKPDGTMRKVLDISKLKSLNWNPKISLKDGLESSYKWFSENYPNVKGC